MKIDINIGDRFEVFECTDATGWGDYLHKGFQSVGAKSPLMPNVNHIEIIEPRGYGTFTLLPGEFRKVGALVITKVQCHICGSKTDWQCRNCEEPVCEGCTMSYNQHTQIDYTLCTSCGYADRD